MFIEKYISFCKEDHSRYSVPTNIEELQGNYEENEYDLFIKTAEGRELYLKKFEALITYLEFHPACIRTRSGDLIKGISLDIDEKLKDRAINLIFL